MKAGHVLRMTLSGLMIAALFTFSAGCATTPVTPEEEAVHQQRINDSILRNERQTIDKNDYVGTAVDS